MTAPSLRRFQGFATLIAAAILVALLTLLLMPGPAAADGIVIPDPPPDHPDMSWRDIPLSIKYHRVGVEIRDQVATTRVDQVFVNDAPFAVEGTYIFPLPEDAAISSFDMTVDGVKYEGRLLGRDEARAIYEEIVRKRRDPALLEYIGRGAFQARIFPIPPKGERRIELVYSQVLQASGGLVHYRYPLNTEKYSAEPIRDVSVDVAIEDRSSIRAVYSPSHPVEVTREDDHHVRVAYHAENVRPDRDFDLYYSLSPDAIAVNLLSYKGYGEDGFFLLLVTPPIRAPEAAIPKDVVLVLDTSGSMEGRKIEQTRAAAGYILDHLGPDDRFDIVGFGTGVRLFEGEPQPLSRREDGRAFIDKLEAAGGTNISRALQEALAGADPDRPTIVIFMTDGLPTAGETNPDRIAASVKAAAPKSARLFAFGVGYDVDTVLLDQLSESLRGASTYVKPDGSIEEAVSGLYEQVSAPVLVDLNARFSGVDVEDLYPYPLPDLFAGNQLVVAGRYRDGGAASLDLTGTVNGQPQRTGYTGLQFVKRGGDEFIPRLWAQRKIGYLLSQIRLHGASEELVKEVVDLSVRYGIITPYTSFLVEEPQQAPGPVSGGPSGRPTAASQPGIGGAPTAAPAAPSVETVVEKALEMLAPGARSGAAAVERAVTEQKLSADGYAAGSGASGQVRQVGDKAFVLRGATWVDTGFDPAVTTPEQVPFGGDGYFALLADHPEIAPYLALGDNVIVVLQGKAYAVEPAGAVPVIAAATTAPGSTRVALPTPLSGTTPAPTAAPTPQAGLPTCPGAAGLVVLGLLGAILPLGRSLRRR
jgi:Ca-activated chloride channel family protein